MDQDPAARWFGVSWGSPFNRECREAPTPVDDTCIYCGETIKMGDQGVLMWGGEDFTRVPAHIDCLLRMVGVENPHAWPDVPDCICRNGVCGHRASEHTGPHGECVVPGCRCGAGGWA